MGAINRPSEVPPEVDSWALVPVTVLMASMHAETNSPFSVKKGTPESVHSI